MRKLTNFRLDASTILLLDEISEEKNISKRAVVEEALLLYNSEFKKKSNSLMKYAGHLSKVTADKMLKEINSSKSYTPIPKL